MKKVIYKLSIVAALTVVGTTQTNAQLSSNEEYRPFNSSSPYSIEDEYSGFGDAISGPGVERTPIGDGYVAILLLTIPYSLYIYRRRRKASGLY
ncbi:MAG: hypothetical protein ACRC6V_04755 [Bacteroidales bacterium]